MFNGRHEIDKRPREKFDAFSIIYPSQQSLKKLNSTQNQFTKILCIFTNIIKSLVTFINMYISQLLKVFTLSFRFALSFPSTVLQNARETGLWSRLCARLISPS